MSTYTCVRIAAVLFALGWSTLAQAANANWPKALTLGTASPGGVYYVYGDGVAQILTEKLGIAVNPSPTQGPVHNVKLVESGGAQLGLTTMGVSLQGWNGTGEWTGAKKHRNMRALFPMYDTPIQALALRKSGLTSFSQFDKKNIGIGPRAGTAGAYVPKILQILGISAQFNYGSFDDITAGLLDGRNDAIVTALGAPSAAFKRAEQKEPLVFISLSPDEREIVRKAIPELSASTIVAGIYTALDKNYETLGLYNFAIGRADLPDDLVYQLVKAIHENQPRLVKIHSTAKETLPENVDKNTFLPFHPGAAKYYREKGFKIPDSLVPTN